jgi:hypothetical protein
MYTVSIAIAAALLAVTLAPVGATAGQQEDDCVLAVSGILSPTTVMRRVNARPVASETVWSLTGTKPAALVQSWIQLDLTVVVGDRPISKTYYCGLHSGGHRVIWQNDSSDPLALKTWIVH